MSDFFFGFLRDHFNDDHKGFVNALIQHEIIAETKAHPTIPVGTSLNIEDGSDLHKFEIQQDARIAVAAGLTPMTRRFTLG